MGDRYYKILEKDSKESGYMFTIMGVDFFVYSSYGYEYSITGKCEDLLRLNKAIKAYMHKLKPKVKARFHEEALELQKINPDLTLEEAISDLKDDMGDPLDNVYIESLPKKYKYLALACEWDDDWFGGPLNEEELENALNRSTKP